MNEDYLQHVWKFKLFKTADLRTVSGKSLEVLYQGVHNHHAGPDFLQAKLRIDGTVWVGHVEVHLKASDWNRHNHQNDPKYKNTILHVVFAADVEIFLRQPGDLEVLDASKYLRTDDYVRYVEWMRIQSWVPCASGLDHLEPVLIKSWLDRVAVERMEKRTKEIMTIYEATGNDWSETFYRRIMRNFGFQVNALAFEMLAEATPLRLVSKHRSDPFQVEAILFGQAGWLQGEYTDEYPRKLQKEFWFLKSKYQFTPLPPVVWNFGRLRPANFPTIRLSQMATLISLSDHLFSRVLEAEPSKIAGMFQVDTSPYWLYHYRFDVFSGDLTEPLTPPPILTTRGRRLGENSIQNVLINTVAPVLFTYGKFKKDQKMIDKSLELLDFCQAEDNKILSGWKKLGVLSANARESQSLIQLHSEYCTHKRCLHCAIGMKLLSA
jgi:hypothetical protein